MNEFDVAVIGAGPAGSTCILALKDSGMQIAWIDRANFPRDKACGDNIPGKAFRALEMIDSGIAEKIRKLSGPMHIHSSSGYDQSGQRLTVNWVLLNYNLEREKFDHELRKVAIAGNPGVHLIKNRIVDVQLHKERVDCIGKDGKRFSARMVIACDGAESVISKKLTGHDPRQHPHCLAVRAYAEQVEGIKEDCNEFYFIDRIMPGYFWIFPLQDGRANIGVGSLYKKSGEIKPAQLGQVLLDLIENDPRLSVRFRKAKITSSIKGSILPLATTKRRISGERFILCGDAASLIDPLWGHGIDNAMWSGLFAAQRAIESFRTNDFSEEFMHKYDQDVHSKLGPVFKKNLRMLKLLVRHPWLIKLAFFFARRQGLVIFFKKLLGY